MLQATKSFDGRPHHLRVVRAAPISSLSTRTSMYCIWMSHTVAHVVVFLWPFLVLVTRTVAYILLLTLLTLELGQEECDAGRFFLFY